MLDGGQYRPAALAALERYAGEPGELGRFFRLFATVSLRALVAGRNTGDVYRTWNALAVALRRGQLSGAGAAARSREVRALYPDDSEFVSRFAALSLPLPRRERLVRYLLGALESDAAGRLVDGQTDPFTIEHILPSTGGPGWDHIGDDERDRFASRLGNYLPLEASLNRALGRSPFADKATVYAQGQYHLTRTVQGEDWTPEHIHQRQRALAHRAAAIWRLDP